MNSVDCSYCTLSMNELNMQRAKYKSSCEVHSQPNQATIIMRTVQSESEMTVIMRTVQAVGEIAVTMRTVQAVGEMLS